MDDKWLNHPAILRILAVLIGVLMWAVVHFDSETQVAVPSSRDTKVIEAVQIQPEGLDTAKYSLRRMEPTVVRIKVEGKLSDLLAATPEDYIVRIDVSEVGAGTFELPLEAELPRGLTLLEMSPSKGIVQIDEIQTKAFDLEVTTEGAPKSGYIVGEPIIKPNGRILVTLPKKDMAQVGSVGTTISIEGADKTFTEKRARIVVYDVDGNVMESAIANPSTIEVEIPITEPFKKIPLQISVIGSLPEGLSMASFKANVEEVTVYGSKDIIDNLVFYDGITFDLSKVSESGVTKLNIQAIDGVSKVEPSELLIEYHIVKEENQTFQDVPIFINGLPEEYKSNYVDPANGKISITVSGAPSELSQLKAEDIQVVADLRGLTPGKHVVSLDVHLPRFVQVANTEPLTATFDIKGPDAPASSPGSGEGEDDASSDPDNGTIEEPVKDVIVPSDGSNQDGGTEEGAPSNDEIP